MVPAMLGTMKQTPANPIAPLLTSQVARRCGVTPDTVRFWERTGRLPSIRTAGGVRLFDCDAVERFAREREAAAADAA